MRAGKLRNMLCVQRRNPDTTSPEWGTVPGEWVEINRIPCEILQISADERVANQGVYAQAEIKAVSRYVPDIKTTDRLTWNGTKLDILGINDLNGRHITLEILCRTNLDA